MKKSFLEPLICLCIYKSNSVSPNLNNNKQVHNIIKTILSNTGAVICFER